MALKHRGMNKTVKGYALGAVAAATYGMNPLFCLPLYADGMHPASVLFFRYLFALPIIALMVRSRGRSFRLERRNVAPVLLFGLLFAVSSYALFRSYNYMDAGIASTLLFVYPILVALIMSVFFKERLTVQTVVCVTAALAGISLLYRSGDGTTLSLAGTLFVLVSAVSYAVYIVGVNQTRLRDVPTLTITFYVIACGVTLFACAVAAEGVFQLPTRWWLWGNLLALALFPTAISLLCTTAAIQCIGSTPTAILGALEPLTAVLFGVTVFGERLTPRICLGMALIIGAVSLVVAGGSVSAALLRLRKLFPRLHIGRHRH